MKKMHGCLIDTATGEAIDAGAITIHDNGAIVVDHGAHAQKGLLVSPYQPNPNRAVLAVPPISQN